MDIEKRKRRQSLRVIISEAIMVVAVIATVSILAFVVSGYWVNSDFEIERQGLLQVYSTPTGANVEVDGNASSWLQRTNTSKTLSAGEHTITLSKDGYDTWTRTINITEGLLYRLHYPRLFLQNRTEESAFRFSVNFATISPDRNTLLLADNTTTWQLFNLDSTSAKLVPVDLSAILPFTSRAEGAETGLFSGSITKSEWANDNEHLLLKIENEGTVNWLLLNVKNPSSSVNLSKEYNANFSRVEILDGSASNLLAVLDGNLRRVDVPAKQLSAILVPNVHDFDHYNQEVVFSAKNPNYVENVANVAENPENAEKSENSPYYLGLLKLGSNEIIKLNETNAKNSVIITKFYDDRYIGVIDETQITLYLQNDFEKKATFDLSFQPSDTKVASEGEAIILYSGGQIMTLDMEAMALTTWTTETDSFGWLDGSMIYAVKDGVLNVYDFNGLNHRTLSSNVSSHFPVTITSDKYLYFFRDGSLIREYLYEK